MFRFVLISLIAASCVREPPQEKEKAGESAEAQPASQPAGRTVSPRNPTQARILEELLRDAEQARPRPIVSEPQVERGRGSAEGSQPGSLLPDGYLVERAGRLVRSGEHVEFHFTSGSPAEGAPNIMEFNKNRWLEAMEVEAEAGVEEFVISAEVTRYRGRNYLNLLKYRRQVSHGNLTP
jgi:hypothetical protein